MSKKPDLWKDYEDIDSKIVVSLERISRVIRILLTDKAEEHGLSPLQTQILTYLRTSTADRGRISRMGREFGLSMPTVSRAVGTLIKKSLVEKHSSETDKRETVLLLTNKGEALADKTSRWADLLRVEVKNLPQKGKPAVLKFLLDFIGRLDQKGVISATRTCMTCRFYTITGPSSEPKSFCLLLDKPLCDSELRADCEDHEQNSKV